jgi:hypothetical protein
MRATGRQKSKPVFAFGKSRRSVGKILGTMAVASVLALTTITSHAAAGEAVFLYGPGGAYYAAGYTVTGGGTVADPLGVTIGTVNGQGVITDSNGNVIGYVTVE